MKNIEMFNLAVGEVLGECYLSFPVPTTISRGTIGGAIEEYYPDYDPSNIDMRKPEYEIAACTISWLTKAGYIWLSEGDEKSRIVKATLSPKGLEVLNAMPKSITTGSIGSNLAKGVKDIGISTFQKLVIHALSQGINFSSASPQI